MSTPRRGVRRPQPQGRPAPQRSAEEPPQPVAPDGATVRPGPPVTKAGGTPAAAPRARLWVRLLSWFSWIVLWATALGAGFLFGKITLSKVFFMAIMLAVTVLPWLRWVREDAPRHLTRDRIAMLQGSLAIFVGLVFALSGAYFLGLGAVVVNMLLAAVVLIRSPRPAPS